jgi:hypothetical protein
MVVAINDQKFVFLLSNTDMVEIHSRTIFTLARGTIQVILVLFLVQFLFLCLAWADASGQSGWIIDSSPKGQVEYASPAYGLLILSVPPAWRSTKNQTDKQRTDVIAFGPQTGRAFRMLLEPLSTDKEINDINDKDIIRLQVEKLSRQFNKIADENQTVLHELRNHDAIGYYFTIKSPMKAKPFEWQCLTQGRIPVGAFYLQFTILSQSPDAQEITQGLKMLATAEYHTLK